MDVNEVGRYWDENAPVWTRLVRMGCDACRDQFNTPAFLCHAPAELRETLPKFRIPAFHRPLSFYLNTLADAGFVLERVCEPSASDGAVERFPLLEDSRLVPFFLIIRARLPEQPSEVF